jgi:hypothetical protein
MRQSFWRNLLLFVPLLFHSPALAGGLFDTFTMEDGMSHNHVNALAQDSLGFLWVATPDGLTRFDGYTFVQYRHDYSDSLSLPANFVGALHVDRSGNLWAGTFSGICRYDPVANGFVRYSINSEFVRGSGDYTATAIWQDNDSVLWIATDRGILQLLPGQHTLIPILTPDQKQHRVNLPAVCFAPDPWVARIWIGLQTGGLAAYDGNKKRLFGFSMSTPEERLLASSPVTSIIPEASISGAADPLVQQRQQMHGPLVRLKRMAEGFTVDRHGFQRCVHVGHSQAIGRPVMQHTLEVLRRERHEQLAKRAFPRGAAVEAQGVPQLGVLAVDPLGDSEIAARALQHGAHDRGQHGL